MTHLNCSLVIPAWPASTSTADTKSTADWSLPCFIDQSCEVCFHLFISCGKYRSLNTSWSAVQSIFVAAGWPRYHVMAPSFNIRGKMNNALCLLSSLKFLKSSNEFHQRWASSYEVIEYGDVGDNDNLSGFLLGWPPRVWFLGLRLSSLMV